MFQYTYKCFQGNVAFAFFGGFPQFPEMASSLGKGHHKNQVQLVTREVPRETCAESDAFLLKLKAVVIRAFKSTYSYKCFYTAALSIVFQLCSAPFFGLDQFCPGLFGSFPWLDSNRFG